MTTRRPSKPIQEKGVYHQWPKRKWYDDTNGDYALIVLQLVLAPIAIPYFWIRKLLRKF